VTILIVSTLQDAHAQAVMRALASQGERNVELLDLSEFPTRLCLSMAFGRKGRQLTLTRSGSGHRCIVDLDRVTSVWWRRPQPFALARDLTDLAARRFALSESATAFAGLWQTMSALWVNDPVKDAAAAHKPYQLALAEDIGLDIPETLMTNDPEAARAFWITHGGDVIHKQFLALPDTWRETRRLRPAERDLVGSVQLAPVIFQKHVDAVADLRVIAIGEELFAAAADLEGANYPTDVRLNLEIRYRPCALPDGIQRHLQTLMRRLGLEYGAIDLRLTPDGRYVFLELNPAGQFLYIEQMTGQPITAALASKLAIGSRQQAKAAAE
jgi:glutathione synthase/RimK-type ligase-like ATP-grasp enzyme